MSTIKIVSNDKKIHGEAGRAIVVDEPLVLGMTSLADLAEALGEDLCVNQIKAQLKVSFRAVVRRKLDEQDDNDELLNTDDAIKGEDFSAWAPTLRVTKSPEEKALEALGNLSPDVREAVLAQYNNA